MASKFDIITIASIKLDGKAVSSFSDGTREVEVFQPLYDQLKKSELTNYRWNFNTYVSVLTLEAVTPTDGRWLYQYLEPSDILQLVSVFDEDGYPLEYLYEQQRIFTNETGPYAKYQRNLTETNFPNYFIDLLVARLAAEAAEPLSGDTGTINRAWEEYNRKWRRAKRLDSQANPAQPIIRSQSPYLNAHWGGTGRRTFKPYGT